MDHSKFRYSKESFSWYRNRNIPKISMTSTSARQPASKTIYDALTPLPPLNSEFHASAIKYYVTSCFEDSSLGYALTPLDGECMKKAQTMQLCMFSSLKFQKTSYILNVIGPTHLSTSALHLVFIILLRFY